MLRLRVATSSHDAPSDADRVRALVRVIDARATAIAKTGAQVVQCDLYSYDSVLEAIQGAARVLYIPPIAARALEGGEIMAKAVRATGSVNFIVSLSQWLANADSPSAMSRAHAAIDALFLSLASVGISATIVNPGFFADQPFLSGFEYGELDTLRLTHTPPLRAQVPHR